MKKLSIHLSRHALEKARRPDEIRGAAIAAYQAAGGGDVFCLAFTAGGQQFALSSRTVIDVDWLSGRIPPKAIREADRPPLSRKR